MDEYMSYMCSFMEEKRSARRKTLGEQEKHDTLDLA